MINHVYYSNCVGVVTPTQLIMTTFLSLALLLKCMGSHPYIESTTVLYEDFASFATRRFSTLTMISGHLKGIFSHKNTQYYISYIYVYFNLYVYNSRDFSLPLAIEMYGWPFVFRAIPT